MSEKYRVIVERERCISCGVAPAVCPQVFELGRDTGKNKVVDTFSVDTTETISVGEISAELYDCAKRAAELCPVGAITIERA
ncbi:MAG: ferredoxin [Fervidicoccaceae archaeon]